MIRGYLAASLDGYIADAEGGVDWLEEFQSYDFGFDAFLAEIGTVVMGRATYDQVMGFGGDWPYAGKRALVLTHRPLGDAPEGVEACQGDIPALLERLRAAEGGDVWIVGGATTQKAFLDAGGLDRLELFLIPVLLGDGVPLWPKGGPVRKLLLRKSESLPGGMIRLDYRVLPQE